MIRYQNDLGGMHLGEIVHSEELLPEPDSTHKPKESDPWLRIPELSSARSPAQEQTVKSIIYEPHHFPITKNPSFGAITQHHESKLPATFSSIVGGHRPQVIPQGVQPIHFVRYSQAPQAVQQIHQPQRIVISGQAPIVRPITIQQQPEKTVSKADADHMQQLQAENDILLKQYEHLYSLYQKEKNKEDEIIEEQPEEESKIVTRKEQVRATLSKTRLAAQFDEFQLLFRGCVDHVLNDRLDRGRFENQRIANDSLRVEVHRTI